MSSSCYQKECCRGYVSIVHLLPPYLHSIDDLHALLATCRGVRSTILDNLPPPTLFSIVYRSRFLPSLSPTWYIVALLAPGIAQWIRSVGSESESNRIAFKLACQNGPQGLLDVAISHPSISTLAELSLGTLRQGWERKVRLLGPISDLVDKCVGEQWRDCEDFWKGGREDAETLWAEPEETIFHLLVYGELFGSGLQEYLHLVSARTDGDEYRTNGLEGHNDSLKTAEADTTTSIKSAKREPSLDTDTWNMPDDMRSFGPSTRLEFIKYCLPDPAICIDHRRRINFQIDSSYPPSPTSPATPLTSAIPPIPSSDHSEHDSGPPAPYPYIHPLKQVEPVGPYASWGVLGRSQHVDSLHHLLTRSPIWARVAKRVRSWAAERVVDTNGRSGAQLVFQLHKQKQRNNSTTHADVALDFKSNTDIGVPADQGESEEFGKPIHECEWDEKPLWRQRLWEDSLWTMGWDGLELIAQAWEEDEENNKARVKSVWIGSANERPVAVNGSHTDTEFERQLSRLADLYVLIAGLEGEPKGIRVSKPTLRGATKYSDATYVFPFLLGDLAIARF